MMRIHCRSLALAFARYWVVVVLCFGSIIGCGTTPAVVEGTLPNHWIDGTDPNEPVAQVHAYNADLYIIRQSVLTNFEAPFLFLLFGADQALLLDSGAGNFPIRETIDGIFAERVASGHSEVPLIVAHLHPHGDHVAGDEELAARPNTTVVGHGVEEVSEYFGIEGWPEQVVSIDLGSREIDVIPIPGHHRAHIAMYDRETGLLFTGDSLYPGRLYVSRSKRRGSFPAFAASMRRLVDFCEGRPLTAVLGTHIEMTKEPGVDYSMEATDHPNERELALGREHLVELADAAEAMVDDPQREVHDDFIIYPTGR